MVKDHTHLAAHLARLLETLGLERRAPPIMDLRTYLIEKSQDAATEGKPGNPETRTAGPGQPGRCAVRFPDRVTKLVRVKASDLLPHPENWRTHDELQRAALTLAFERIGIANVVLVRELPDARLQIIDGHARTELVGDQPIPCVVLDVTEEEARELLASLDPIAGMAGMNAEALAALVAKLAPDAGAFDLVEAVWPDFVLDTLQKARWATTPTDPTATGRCRPPAPCTSPGTRWWRSTASSPPNVPNGEHSPATGAILAEACDRAIAVTKPA